MQCRRRTLQPFAGKPPFCPVRTSDCRAACPLSRHAEGLVAKIAGLGEADEAKRKMHEKALVSRRRQRRNGVCRGPGALLCTRTLPLTTARVAFSPRPSLMAALQSSRRMPTFRATRLRLCWPTQRTRWPRSSTSGTGPVREADDVWGLSCLLFGLPRTARQSPSRHVVLF